MITKSIPSTVTSQAATSSITNPLPSTSKASESSASEISTQSHSVLSTTTGTFQYEEPLLCLTPHQDANIHRPYVNLSELLSSYNLCLNSYEDRIGATVRGEELSTEHLFNFKEMIKSNAKRQRHDSGSEKKSPDMKRAKSGEGETLKPSTEQDEVKKSLADSSVFVTGDEANAEMKYENEYKSTGGYEGNLFEMEGISQITETTSSADECDKEEGSKVTVKTEQTTETATNSLGLDKTTIKQETMDLQEPVIIVPDCIKQNLAGRYKPTKNNLMTNKKRNKDMFRPLINEGVIKKIRQGWTVDDVGDITIGDLYLMFGQDSKIFLEYKWIPTAQNDTVKTESAKNAKTVDKDNDSETKSNVHEVDKPKSTLSNKLKQLLMLAHMTEKTKRRTSCACGHVCDRNLNKGKVRFDDILFS